MKTRDTIHRLFQLGRILSKIAYICAIVGSCGSVIGILSLHLGSGDLLKIGGVTIHGLIATESGLSIGSITAALSGWMIVCAGEAVLAKFAEVYFQHALEAGTPFTYAGAKEMQRLGILALTIPIGCAVLGRILEEITAGLMHADTGALGLHSSTDTSIVFGIFFLLMSLLCRYGAELREGVQ